MKKKKKGRKKEGNMYNAKRFLSLGSEAGEEIVGHPEMFCHM
jgi:hypothetical protein